MERRGRETRGPVEVDETKVGGLYSNMHIDNKPFYGTNPKVDNKSTVIAANQQGGKARAQVIPDAKAGTL